MLSGIFNRLVIFVLLSISVVAFGQGVGELAIYKQLNAPGQDSVTALDEVLKKSDTSSACVLYAAATVAYREKRIEDASFLVLIGKLRGNLDLEIFPAVETGTDNPLHKLASLDWDLFNKINPEIMMQPKAFASVLERVKAWQPKISADYDPGWKFGTKGTDAEAKEFVERKKKEVFDTFGGISTLLLDDAYFSAYKVAADYYYFKAGQKDRPSKAELEKAEQTLRDIEKKKRIKGPATMKSEENANKGAARE